MDAVASESPNVDAHDFHQGISPMDAFASPNEPEARPLAIAAGSTTTREITMDKPEIQQDTPRRSGPGLVIPSNCADGAGPRRALVEYIMHSMDDCGIQDLVSQDTVSAITQSLTVMVPRSRWPTVELRSAPITTR